MGRNDPDRTGPDPERRRNVLQALIPCALVLLTLAVYWSVRGHGFISVDDEDYVTRNRHVLSGLTWQGVRWTFTAFHSANWHPLTWLSHMADVELFGLDAGKHHLVSVAFHAANAALLYFALWRMTGFVWRSAFVAALFAVHPLHVESVAWVAERKDVLSAFFWMLTLWAYAGYARSGGVGRYVSVVLFLAAGLMSKPMAVTLPFVLLLLDYWPLGRAKPGKLPPSKLVVEKLPLFALSAASSVVTFIAQQYGGAVGSKEAYPIGLRAANAVVSYADYLLKMLWPGSLAVYYPHPADTSAGIPPYLVGMSALGLLLLSWAAVRRLGERPYLAVGWAWYVGTLFPVIGIVQVGGQAMADRYTYIPMIGISLAVAWGIPEAFPSRNGRLRARILGVAAVAAILALAAAAAHQLSYWKNGRSLFARALEVTQDNWPAYFNLGDALLKEGNIDEAIANFQDGLRIRPDEKDARLNLGIALGLKERHREAIVQFEEVLRRNPGDAVAHADLGVALSRVGKEEEGIAHLREAVRLKPNFVDGYTNLGGVLLQMGRVDEAVVQLRYALDLSPNDRTGLELMESALAMRARR